MSAGHAHNMYQAVGLEGNVVHDVGVLVLAFFSNRLDQTWWQCVFLCVLGLTSHVPWQSWSIFGHS